jgi:hypothetical protein
MKLSVKDLKPNWPAMTKNREKNSMKKHTNETKASRDKIKQTKQRGHFACIKRAVFSAEKNINKYNRRNRSTLVNFTNRVTSKKYLLNMLVDQ